MSGEPATGPSGEAADVSSDGSGGMMAAVKGAAGAAASKLTAAAHGGGLCVQPRCQLFVPTPWQPAVCQLWDSMLSVVAFYGRHAPAHPLHLQALCQCPRPPLLRRSRAAARRR